MMPALVALLAAGAGAGAGSILACVPALHVYNVLALGAALLAAAGTALPSEVLLPLAAGLVVGWTINNTIPSVLLGAADESAVFMVLPGQTYLMAGRGFEAVMLTAAGALGGLIVLLGVAAPLLPRALPLAIDVLRPHYHWILWCVIAFMLQAEWPKTGGMGQGGWARLLEGWRTPAAGLLTFALAGLLGFVLLFRSPIAPEAGFQNIMPAFVGLFGAPWLLLNAVSGPSIPAQRMAASLGASPWHWLRGVGAGAAGGAFAAFFPGVTGGVGGMLAGHATAQTDDRAFLISQGASKTVYYVGALLLFFVPGAGLTRGGAAWMLRITHVAGGWGDYWLVLGSIAVAGAVALLLAAPLTRLTIRAIERWDYRRASALVLAAMAGLVYAVTGLPGLAVAFVSTGIGLIPILYGSRRMNCLGVILLPLACNLSGIGATAAAFLGLL